ncbi:MAG: radical SAM protein [Nitrospirae bacterium]|nr:radical SAM protein [Nitrospirota bacterium]
MYQGPAWETVKSAIVDLTDRCNLRCKHCFYYREQHDSEELPADELLAGLKVLRDRHHVQAMAWCGGEPLLRTDVLEQGAALFPMNWIFSNGTLPIPDVSNAMQFVSVEGPKEIHDKIRGRGTYDKIMATVANRPGEKPIVFLPTIHKLNAPFLEQTMKELSKITNAFLGVEFFTPLKEYRPIKGYPHVEIQKKDLDLTWEERDRIIDRLFALKKSYPGFIVVRDRVLELMRSEYAPTCIEKCNMPNRCLTLDVKLNRKQPCVLGKDVDCSKCGCIFPYEQQARAEEKASGKDTRPLFF